MWYLVQVVLAFLVFVSFLFLGWLVVWRLVLSRLSWFQEIFGLRSAKAVEIAALKKRKQQQANTFVITRSGEQAQRQRDARRTQAAHAAAAVALAATRANAPTTTPIAANTQTTTPAAHSPRMNNEDTYASPTQPQPQAQSDLLQRRRDSSAASAVSSASAPPPTLAAVLTAPITQRPSALPQSNRGAAALAAEALHRRHAAMAASTAASSVSTPSQPVAPAGAREKSNPTGKSAATIGGTAWLSSAAIMDDYVR